MDTVVKINRFLFDLIKKAYRIFVSKEIMSM